MTEEQIINLASDITKRLFQSNGSVFVTRLVLVSEDEVGDMKQTLGGYCQQAVFDMVYQRIKEATEKGAG